MHQYNQKITKKEQNIYELTKEVGEQMSTNIKL